MFTSKLENCDFNVLFNVVVEFFRGGRVFLITISNIVRIGPISGQIRSSKYMYIQARLGFFAMFFASP